MRPGGRPTSFHGDAVLADTVLVIGTDSGTQPDSRNAIWAFDPAQGAMRWSSDLDDGVVSDIVREGDRVFAITRNDALVCLDLTTGAQQWSFVADSVRPQSELVYRSPLVVHDRVFYGDMRGRLHALSVRTGGPLWTMTFDTTLATGCLVIRDRLLIGDARGMIHRIDPETGAHRIGFATGIQFNGPPVAAGDSLVFLEGSNAILCVDPDANQVRWMKRLPVSSSRPYIWHGAVWVATSRRELFALGLSDGAVLWSHPFPGIIRGIGWDDDTLYLGTQEGVLYAIPADDVGDWSQ